MSDDRGIVATLTFPLPECTQEFKDALHGNDYLFALQELDNWIQQEIKHRDNHHFQPVRDKLYELIDDLGIVLWR